MANNESSKVKGYPDYIKSEDPKIGKPYELYGADKTIEDSNSDLGWSVGPNVTAEEYELQKDRTFNEIRDPNADTFRYGLWQDIHSNIQDPTILGFTVEIDDTNNSPLFSTGSGGALSFINKYSAMPEISARKRILEHFQKNIKMMFKSKLSTKTDDNDLPYVKSHYLEKVLGLKVLSNKFMKYKEEELVFTMYEDVTMYAQYLTQLYNNLAYSYRSGKNMIPENLLRFNLTIKISEIRNFKTVVKTLFDSESSESAKRTLININSSYIQYTLYDCNFDFFESQNHGDDIQIGGIGASVASTSNMDFKLQFKRVSRLMKTEIVDDFSGSATDSKDASRSTNARMDLNDREYDPWYTLPKNAFFKSAPTQADYSIDKQPTNDFAKNAGPSNLSDDTQSNVNGEDQRDENRTKSSPNMQTDSALNESLQSDENGNSLKGKAKKIKERAKQDLLNNANKYKDSRARDLQKLKSSLIGDSLGALQDVKDGLLEKFRRQRGDLLNQLINDIKEDVGLTQITPDNVYKNDFDPNSIDNIIKDLGSNIGGDIEDFIKGFNNF